MTQTKSKPTESLEERTTRVAAELAEIRAEQEQRARAEY